eukprot:scaffold43996_cov24-Tisochrysis_lutea.AAC.1
MAVCALRARAAVDHRTRHRAEQPLIKHALKTELRLERVRAHAVDVALEKRCQLLARQLEARSRSAGERNIRARARRLLGPCLRRVHRAIYLGLQQATLDCAPLGAAASIVGCFRRQLGRLLDLAEQPVVACGMHLVGAAQAAGKSARRRTGGCDLLPCCSEHRLVACAKAGRVDSSRPPQEVNGGASVSSLA